MKDSVMKELIQKKDLIDRVSVAIVGEGRVPSVTNVVYEAYEHEEGYRQEIIKMTYNGGAIAIRNVNANSQLANLSEVAKLCYGGHYGEVDAYKEMVADPKWKKVI